MIVSECSAHLRDTLSILNGVCIGIAYQTVCKRKGELQQNKVSCLLRKIPRLLDTYGKIDVE